MEKTINYESNITRITDQLERGRRITVQSILDSVGTQELRHYIPIIRRRFGMIIDSEWREKNGKRFKEYYKRKEQKAA